MGHISVHVKSMESLLPPSCTLYLKCQIDTSTSTFLQQQATTWVPRFGGESWVHFDVKTVHSMGTLIIM